MYPHFQYLSKVLNLEVIVLIFARSIRLKDFDLYKFARDSLLHFLFKLEHVHYTHWLLVQSFYHQKQVQ